MGMDKELGVAWLMHSNKHRCAIWVAELIKLYALLADQRLQLKRIFVGPRRISHRQSTAQPGP